MGEPEDIDIETVARRSVVSDFEEALENGAFFNVVAASAGHRQALLGALMRKARKGRWGIRALNATNHRRDFVERLGQELEALRSRPGLLIVDQWYPRFVDERALGTFQRRLRRERRQCGTVVVFGTAAPLSEMEREGGPSRLGPELLEEVRELNYDARLEILRRAQSGDGAAQKMAETLASGPVLKALGIGAAAVGLGLFAKNAVSIGKSLSDRFRSKRHSETEGEDEKYEGSSGRSDTPDVTEAGDEAGDSDVPAALKSVGVALGMGLASLIPGVGALSSVVAGLGLSTLLSKTDLEKIGDYLKQHRPDFDGEMEEEAGRAAKWAAHALAWQKFLIDIARPEHTWILEEARQLGCDLTDDALNFPVYLERTGQAPAEFSASLFRPSDLRRVFDLEEVDGSRREVLEAEFEAWKDARGRG